MVSTEYLVIIAGFMLQCNKNQGILPKKYTTIISLLNDFAQTL